MTNRDLYTLVRNIEGRFKGKATPSLEEYLRSLWMLASQTRASQPTIQKFADWIERAFLEAPPAFDPDWMQISINYAQDASTYESWENLILFQIADLRRMALAGLLDNEFRYFGINSPSGARWYNFDPLTYLECGVRGNWGGYEEDEVIVLIPSPEGESNDSPVQNIETISWEDLSHFLECGQLYE